MTPFEQFWKDYGEMVVKTALYVGDVKGAAELAFIAGSQNGMMQMNGIASQAIDDAIGTLKEAKNEKEENDASVECNRTRD